MAFLRKRVTRARVVHGKALATHACMTFHTATVGVVALIGALSMPAAAWAQLELTTADQTAVVEPERPLGAALRALEASLIGLQALDVVSTMRAIERGHTETNPLMHDVAGRPAAMVAVKAGSTAATVWLVRRLAKRNRVAALATMVAIDAAYAAVVARNFHVASR